jgi:lipopolysaccharide export system protein LptA
MGGKPITIKSNELSTDSKSRTATFTGKVSARQGDMTIYADKLVVRYKEDGGDVEKVEATGGVRIVQGDRLATAREAVYLSSEQRIVLTGDPKVFQGENTISGKVITYFVNEERSVVTGGADSRVEAVIHPKDKGKDGSKR